MTSGKVEQYCRFRRDGQVSFGRVLGDEVVTLSGAPWSSSAPVETDRFPLLEVRLLNPVQPGKILAVGLNYPSHLGDRVVGDIPGIFVKLPNTIIGTGDPIPYPDDATLLHAEGELVVVIGNRARHIAPEEVDGYIFGVTCGNDISERHWQSNDLQWMRAKSSDGFGPIGPQISCGLDYHDLELTTRLNGEVVQNERTSRMIFSIAEIVAFITRYVTLEPGDIIFTGTPGTTATINPGDEVEVEIEGCGVLRNPVVGDKFA